MDDETDFIEVSIISNTAMNLKLKMSPLEVVRVKEILKTHLGPYYCSSDEESEEESSKEEESSGKDEDGSEEEESRSPDDVPQGCLDLKNFSSIPGILSFISHEPDGNFPASPQTRLPKSELSALSDYITWTQTAALPDEENPLRVQIEWAIDRRKSFTAAIREDLQQIEGQDQSVVEDPEESKSSQSSGSPDRAKNWSKVCCQFKCPFTGKEVFVYWDEGKDLHYVQRGQHTTSVFDAGYSLGLEFDEPAASYSGKWYLVGYPDAEPQEKALYVFDQENLTLRCRYGFDTGSEYSSDIHFLKPHKELYPLLMNTGQELYLLVEFQHRLYPVASLRNSQENPMPEIDCLVHLADRAWLCLETLKKAHVLIVDSKKLYQFLQVN